MTEQALAPKKLLERAVAAVVVGAEDAAEDILSRLSVRGDREAVRLSDPEVLLVDGQRAPRDVTLVTVEVMRRLAKMHGEKLEEFCARHHVSLVVRCDEFLDSTPFLEMVESVIFRDVTLDYLDEAVTLGGAGYSILPRQAIMDIVSDRLRCDTVARLSPLELALLAQMRRGEGNRTIAMQLGIPEAKVKTKVRALLKSLKLKNRTDAAVFAARQEALIRQVTEHHFGGEPAAESPAQAAHSEAPGQPMVDEAWASTTYGMMC
jgi:DNA-binding NarL/FixJ family response regulator